MILLAIFVTLFVIGLALMVAEIMFDLDLPGTIGMFMVAACLVVVVLFALSYAWAYALGLL